MPTLGEELRHKREQRRITLAEIAEATRIGTRFLKAIETDNFSILPGGIFTRSFIRAYAKYVGMNEEEAIGLYLQQVAGPIAEQQESQDQISATHVAQVEKLKKRAPPIARPEPAVDHSRRFEPVALRQSQTRTNWPTIVIGAGILIFVVLIVLALVKQFNQGGAESGSQAASVAQKNAPSKPVPQPSNPSPGVAAVPPRAEQPPSGAPQPAPGEPLVVKLEAATGESWVKYQVDDSKPTTLVLKQGQSQDLPPAERQVTLNCGNRLTLKLKINNRDANFPPDTPKFKSKVVISRDNLQTFFQ
jgi:cytoskeleton protein RodZ